MTHQHVDDWSYQLSWGEEEAKRFLGLSQEEMARKLGVDPSTLGKWERGKG
jgi:transcriptional regulator with XRE-family HTH domain